MTYAGHLFAAYGYSNQLYHIFLATGLRRGDANREREEQDLVTAQFPISEIERMIRDGDIKDDTTVAALGLLRLKGLLENSDRHKGQGHTERLAIILPGPLNGVTTSGADKKPNFWYMVAIPKSARVTPRGMVPCLERGTPTRTSGSSIYRFRTCSGSGRLTPSPRLSSRAPPWRSSLLP
jgi:hypothetical protein